MDIILRNMEDLSEEEFRELKFYLRAYGGVPKTKLDNADRRHVVQLMVEYAPLELMKYIRMIFEQMDRKDLLELLTAMSDAVSSVKTRTGQYSGVCVGPEMDIILRNLKGLSEEEFRKLKFYLKTYGGIPQTKLDNADRRRVVQLMVEYAPYDLVEYIRTILEDMDRDDFLELLAAISDTISVTGEQAEQNSSMANKDGSEMAMILRTLEDLSEEEFRKLKFYLRTYGIPKSKLENADRADVVELVMAHAPHELMNYIRNILEQMDRNDLLELLRNL